MKQAKRHMDLNVQGDLVTSNPLSFRNRIINGDCSVAQRGNVSINSNTTAYGGCDRIAVQTASFTTVAGTIAQAGSLGSGSSSSGYVQQFGAVTTTGSGTISFIQRIEAINCADLNSKTVTISLTLYQDTGSTLSPTINLYKPNALDNWSGSTFLQGTTVSLPTTARTRFTFTATLGATDASNGLAVQVNIPVGAVSTKYFQIMDIQLESGSSATPFERRPIGMELQLCQRYFFAIKRGIIATGSGNMLVASIVLPTTMRTNPAPSLSTTNIRWGDMVAQAYTSTNAVASANPYNSPEVAVMYITSNDASYVAYRTYLLEPNSADHASIYLSAEL